VVVTGVGPVTPIGIGRESFWAAALSGTDASDEIRAFDTSLYKVHRACEVRDFDPPEVEGKPGRASTLAVAAADLALRDAGLAPPLERAGVVIGTTGGEIQVLERLNRIRNETSQDGANSGEFSKHPCHVISANVARHFGLSGPNIVVPTACAAGNYAVAIGRDWIESGRSDIVLAGGSDPLSKIAFTGFGRLGAIAPDRCRPFDRNRRGLLVSEGAAILVLESLDSARARAAKIYAEIRGSGFSCDAYHLTIPHPEGTGVRLAMARALEDARIEPEQVDYVSAHGTGTPANDRIEAGALHSLFRDRIRSIPVSSIKSMIGHTMGAASAIETIACVLAIDTGFVPPTINYETPDPECDLDVVPNAARETPVHVALNNAYAFGGNNSCLVIARVAR
jgi:3-oxoacyl-[acyl-carrier-protein] synthase II